MYVKYIIYMSSWTFYYGVLVKETLKVQDETGTFNTVQVGTQKISPKQAQQYKNA